MVVETSQDNPNYKVTVHQYLLDSFKAVPVLEGKENKSVWPLAHSFRLRYVFNF